MSVLRIHNKNITDGFVSIDIGPHNIDLWLIRKSILAALRKSYPMFHGDLIDIGCGKMPYKEEIRQKTEISSYIGLDIENAFVYDAMIRPDVTWNGVTIPFPNQSFDTAIATEVFEHVHDIGLLLREVRRVLRPGGVLFFTTPFIWPYHETPHDCQRWTSFGMEGHLKAAGFRGEEITCDGNWHSSLAQMIGLWVARAPMSGMVRRLIRYPAFAMQKILMRFEGESQPMENPMPRCISGTARI